MVLRFRNKFVRHLRCCIFQNRILKVCIGEYIHDSFKFNPEAIALFSDKNGDLMYNMQLKIKSATSKH